MVGDGAAWRLGPCGPGNGGRAWARWDESRSGVELSDDLQRGCRQFAAMRLSAVVVGHTSSSVVGGKGWDAAAASALSAALGPDVIVSTNGLDTLAALLASRVRQPFLVLPPWFPDDTVKAAVGYYAEHGFAPAAHLRVDPGRKWRDLPPGRAYAPAEWVSSRTSNRSMRRSARPARRTADGVLIAGTGFRCVAILQTLEHDLGRPVISANQASLWNCLRLAGIRAPVAGYGNLLTT